MKDTLRVHDARMRFLFCFWLRAIVRTLLFSLGTAAIVSDTAVAQDLHRIARVVLDTDFTGVLLNALLPIQVKFGSTGTINLVDFRYCGAPTEADAKLLAIGSLAPPPSWLAARRMSQSSNVLDPADCTRSLNQVATRLGSGTSLDAWLAIAPADAVVAEVSAHWTGEKITFNVIDLGFFAESSQSPPQQVQLTSALRSATFETNNLSQIQLQTGGSAITLSNHIYFGLDNLVLAVSSVSSQSQFPKLPDLNLEPHPALSSVIIDVPFGFANDLLRAILASEPITVKTESALFGDIKIVSGEIEEHGATIILQGKLRDKDGKDFGFVIDTISTPSSANVNSVAITPPAVNCDVPLPRLLDCLGETAVDQGISRGLSALLSTLWKGKPLYSVNQSAGVSLSFGGKKVDLKGKLTANSSTSTLAHIAGNFTLKLP